jgi:hypothetical protein
MLVKLKYDNIAFNDLLNESLNSNYIQSHINHNGVNDYINDSNFLESHPFYKSTFEYFNSIFPLLNFKLHFQSSNKDIDWHVDDNDTDKLRFIMPIITNELVLSYVEEMSAVYEFVMFPGYIYHFNIQNKHKVNNLGTKNRIALIFDIENTIENKKIINDMFEKII